MGRIHVVATPISGIVLQGFDELVLGTAMIFNNPAASPFLQSRFVPPELDIMMYPNVTVPSDSVIKGAPPSPYDGELKQLGVARYLLQVEFETPTNELTGKQQKEELEWAILPLRILMPARILVGLSQYCRGGCVHSGGEYSREKVKQEGLLASAPIAAGWSSFCKVTQDVSQQITKFALVIIRNRAVLSEQLRVPLDTYWNSFYLPSYADRGMQLLTVLESLLSEKKLRTGIRGRVAKRVRDYQVGNKIETKRRQRLIDEAFGMRKDVEHGYKSRTEVEEYFEVRIKDIEEAVRYVFYKTTCLLNQGMSLHSILPGLKQLET